MHSSDAVGWRRHYLFGTRELIRRLGPRTCRSGIGKTMLTAIRILEIISTILYASRSFLATPPWLETMAYISESENRGSQDAILSLAIVCADHCLQFVHYYIPIEIY